jgi:hypothetical protein
MSCRQEAVVSFVELGILEPQNSTPVVFISRNLAPFEKLSRKVIPQNFIFQSSAPFICGHPQGRGLSTQQVHESPIKSREATSFCPLPKVRVLRQHREGTVIADSQVLSRRSCWSAVSWSQIKLAVNVNAVLQTDSGFEKNITIKISLTDHD